MTCTREDGEEETRQPGPGVAGGGRVRQEGRGGGMVTQRIASLTETEN